jgi:hypothetical protein
MLIDYCIPTCTCTHTKLSKTSFFFETILNLKRHSFWDGGSCLDPLLKWIDENDTIYYLSPVLAGGIEPVEQWSGFSLKPRNLGFESGYIIQRGPTNLPSLPHCSGFRCVCVHTSVSVASFACGDDWASAATLRHVFAGDEHPPPQGMSAPSFSFPPCETERPRALTSAICILIRSDPITSIYVLPAFVWFTGQLALAVQTGGAAMASDGIAPRGINPSLPLFKEASRPRGGIMGRSWQWAHYCNFSDLTFQ